MVAAGMIIGRFRRLPSVPFFSFPFSLFPLFEVRIGELNGIFAFSNLFFFFCGLMSLLGCQPTSPAFRFPLLPLLLFPRHLLWFLRIFNIF